VIIPEVVHFFFSTVISGVEEVAINNGYNVILCQTNENHEREKKIVETMISNRVDGVLVSYARETHTFEHFQKLKDMGLPVVFFDRIPDMDDTVNVIVDDAQGAYQAVKHLLDQGYEDILHLSGPKNLAISKLREEGCRKALQEAGKVLPEDRIIECPHGTIEESERICMKVFVHSPPDAIFASNDVAAAGAMRAAKEMGIKVPDQLGVMGFSNWQFSSMVDPPLSTVSQPGFEIGEKAASLLLEMIENHRYIPRTEVLETQLIVRKSTLPQKTGFFDFSASGQQASLE
jgi:LacI family transcriptional regulator